MNEPSIETLSAVIGKSAALMDFDMLQNALEYRLAKEMHEEGTLGDEEFDLYRAEFYEWRASRKNLARRRGQ